jgi:RimJ/RimL family protein N-acetyltransferase
LFPDEIRTERLLLRLPRLDDAQAIFEGYAQDPEVTRYLTFKPAKSLAEDEAFLRRVIDERRAGTAFTWMLTRPPEDNPIGVLESRVKGHSVSLGYVLKRREWGKGYMSEVVRGVIEQVFKRPEIYRVWAVCDVDNRASARVMEKVGMVLEGRLARYIMHPNISNEPRNVFLYAIVR